MLRLAGNNSCKIKRAYKTAFLKRYNSTESGTSSIQGFNVLNEFTIPRLALTATSLEHARTKAKHLHIKRADDNNVFAIGFKTNPPDMTGLPHILEHLTLCGSEKYPVKDPFFKMLTRSLSNFMNAMTGTDYTYYPFATTNHKDFRNLQSVYLDAVYSPLLRKDDFRQEGWRLEPEDSASDQSPLIYKGVVFNEMKGQLSNPSYLFYIKYLQSIYPSLQCSGGDPAYITSLKYEDLKKFHHTRYHPSNAFSFSYGDLPLEQVLAPLEKSMAKFDSAEVDQIIHQPINLDSHQKAEIEGPYDPMLETTKQHRASLTWIVGDSNAADSYTWSVLSLLLTSGHSSPFYQALIDSGMGPQFSVNTGLDQQPGKNLFSIGLDGISEETIPKLKDTIFEVLNNVANNGFPQEQLDAIINQVELSNREVQPQFGLELTHRLFPRVFNDSNFVKLIDSEKRLEDFRAKYLSNPEIFQQLIKDQLLSKPYFEFIMKPAEDYESNLEKQESERLNNLVESLSDAEKKEIYSSTKAQEDKILDVAEEEKLIETLPTLTVDDISPNARRFAVGKNDEAVFPIELYTRETGTQGLTYMSLLNNLSQLPRSLYPLLPLYSEALTNLGTSRHSMADLEQLIRLNTGGVSANILTKPKGLSDASSELYLSMGGLAVDEKIGTVYSVLEEILSSLDYSNIDKLKQIIQGAVANSTEALSSGGHRFALGHAAAAVSSTSRLKELLGGIEQVQFMKELSKLNDEQLADSVMPKLQEISKTASTLSNARVGLTFTADEGALDKQIGELHKFVGSLNRGFSKTTTVEAGPLTPSKTLFQLPFQVSYAGLAVSGASYLDEDSAALTLLADLLSHKYLHPEIREKGGAYGGGASYSAMDGIFSFYSYRDPNPVNTLNVIKKSGEWSSKDGRFSDRNLVEAKLSIFQRLDQPISPRSEIDSQFVYGIDDETRQERRQKLLAVTLDDVQKVAEKYLTRDALENASTTVIGPENDDLVGNDWKKIDVGTE